MKVCVFGSSNSNTRFEYVKEAERLGSLIASKGLICVNGAGKFGNCIFKYIKIP